MRFSKVLAVVVLSFMCGIAAYAAEIHWQPHNMQAAMAKAQQEQKLVYIFVEGSNCPPCDSFKFSHLNDPVFVDFVNTLFVPMKFHESNGEDRAILESLRLTHGAVPRFYVLSSEGRGVSMVIGTVSAAPLGAVEVLRMATGHQLPVNRQAAAELAMRIRNYAAQERQAGRLYADPSLRHVGVAAVEAWAWALAGRIDEAERAWGPEWAGQLMDQEIRYHYVNFWTKWGRNPQGSLKAADDYVNSAPGDPAGSYILGLALAANGRYNEAVRVGESLLASNPDNTAIANEVSKWRSMAGM